jgi:hypothetical protein
VFQQQWSSDNVYKLHLLLFHEVFKKMGADMIISCIAIPKTNIPKLKDLFAKIHQNIDIMTEQDVKAYLVNEQRDDGFMEEMTFDEYKEELHSIVSAVEQDLDARDVTAIEHRGDIIYITGGLSWGDNVTDSMDDFDAFNNIPEWITQPLFTV